MPREITIDGLVIDDRNEPKNYRGPFLFTDPDGAGTNAEVEAFPYAPTQQVTIRNLTTASGKNPDFAGCRVQRPGRGGGGEVSEGGGMRGDGNGLLRR